MCGFLLFLDKSNNISNSTFKKLDKISNLLSHRGPDFKRSTKDKNIFMHHSRLSIQDINKRSNQPLFKNHKGKKYSIIYNGEIYNFKKIRSKLKKKIKFNTTGDTEVILNSFILDKDSFLRELNGMYSFIILEHGNNPRIYFARDVYGQKPLYFFQDEKKLIFCSEIKPILKIINKYKISRANCLDYLLNNEYFYQRNTFYEGVKQILPNERGSIINNNIYFNENKNRQLTEIKKPSYNLYFKKFKENIINHSISDKKIALSLSSGLDSSSIAHVLYSQKVPYDLMAYSIDFEGEYSEFNEAKKFTDSYNKKIKKVLITQNHVINNFEKYVKINEGPLGGIMLIGLFKLAHQCKKDGYDVLFSGFGSDECFGSYANTRLKLKEKKSFDLIDNTRIDNHDSINESENYLLNNILDDYFKVSRIPRAVHFTDRVSMSSSVEMRNPFLDENFVAFSRKQKLYFKNTDKYILKKFMSIHSKYKKNWFEKKKHVTHPQNKWLKNKNFGNFAEDIIKDNYLYKNYDFLNKRKILNRWNLFKDKKILNGYFFWQLLNIYFLKKLKG